MSSLAREFIIEKLLLSSEIDLIDIEPKIDSMKSPLYANPQSRGKSIFSSCNIYFRLEWVN